MKNPDLDALEVIRATDGRQDLEVLARHLALEQAASVEHAGLDANRDEFVESVRDIVMDVTHGIATQRHLPLSDPRAHEPFDMAYLQAISEATSRIIASRA